MASTRPIWRSLLLAVAWLLIVVGGFLLLFGGAYIQSISNTGRWIAEAEGDGLAAVSLVGGFILNSVAEKISDLEVDEKRSDESTQK